MGKSLTKAERQSKLDRLKWIASEVAGNDLSGKMEWCKACTSVVDGVCQMSQAERASTLACATAYNKSRKNKGKF